MMKLPPQPWQPGFTLLTQETRRWSKEQFDRNDAEERLRIFSNFRAEDQGRSRQLICTIQPGEFADAVAAIVCQSPALLEMLIRIHGAEFGYGMWPEQGEITKLINDAGGII